MRVGPAAGAAPAVPCAPAVSIARAVSVAAGYDGAVLVVSVLDDGCELHAPARAPTRARVAIRRVPDRTCIPERLRPHDISPRILPGT